MLSLKPYSHLPPLHLFQNSQLLLLRTPVGLLWAVLEGNRALALVGYLFVCYQTSSDLTSLAEAWGCQVTGSPESYLLC